MMRQRTSTYTKMYLVSPAIYERLLNCLDDSEKMQAEAQNKPGDDPPPKRPSEQIIENIHLEEMGQQPTPPPPLPPPPNIYPDLSEEMHRERMGGTLYPVLPGESDVVPVQPMIDEEIIGEVYGPPTNVIPEPPWGELEGDMPPPMLPPPTARRQKKSVRFGIPVDQFQEQIALNEVPTPPMLPPPASQQRPRKSVRFGVPVSQFQEQVALKHRQRLPKMKPLRKYRFGTPIIEPIQQPIQPISPPMPAQHIVTQEAYRRELAKQACGKDQLCAIKRERIPKNICPICGRAFGRSWNLSRHMSVVHTLPDEDIPMRERPMAIKGPSVNKTYMEQFPGWHPPMALKNPYKRGIRRTRFSDPYFEKVLKLDDDRGNFERWLDEPD